MDLGARGALLMKSRMSFRSRVLEAFSGVIEGFGFACPKGIAGADFVQLVQRVREEICLYVFVRDDRRGRGSVRCNLWVAPIDFPDDGFDRLNLGFNLLVGESFDAEPTATFYTGIAHRVELLVPELSGIVTATEKDLDTPSLSSKRQIGYKLERAAYKALRNFSEMPSGEYWKKVFQVAALIAQGKQRYDTLEAACEVLAARMFDRGEEPKELRHQYFSAGPEITRARMTAMALSRQFYIEALCPKAHAG